MNFIINKFRNRDIWSNYFLYLIYFLLGMYYPLFSFMRQTFPDHMGIVVLYNHVLILLLLVKIILQKNSLVDWIFVFILLYLCRKSYQYNYDFYNIFGTMMFLCCAKNIEINKIIRLDLFLRVIRSILFLTFPFIELMVNHINYIVGSRERTFFGWTHPNMMGLDFLLLSLDIMYLRKEKKKWYDIFLYILIIVFLDKTANSRTAEVIIAGLIIIQLLSILLKESWVHNIIVLFTSGAFLLCIGIPSLGSYRYTLYPDFFLEHDNTMVSRIQLTLDFYNRNGRFALYGFPIEESDCLDMMYPYIGLHWGLAAMIIITLAISYTIYKAAQKHDTGFLILLLCFLIYGWSEVAHVYPVYSYFSLLIGYYIMNYPPIIFSTEKVINIFNKLKRV